MESNLNDLNRSFDNLIHTDPKGNFMLESSPKCFNTCIKDITEEQLNESQKLCLLSCYGKMYYSFANTHLLFKHQSLE